MMQQLSFRQYLSACSYLQVNPQDDPLTVTTATMTTSAKTVFCEGAHARCPADVLCSYFFFQVISSSQPAVFRSAGKLKFILATAVTHLRAK